MALAKSAEPEMLSFAESLKSNYTFIKFLCIYSPKYKDYVNLSTFT
jgi:hypothetical protein